MRPTSGSCANVLPTLDNLTPTLRLLCGCVRFRGRFVVGVKASLLGKSRSHLGISQTRSLPGRTDLTTSIKIDVVSSCLSPSASGSASRDRQDDRSSFHLDPWGEPSPQDPPRSSDGSGATFRFLGRFGICYSRRDASASRRQRVSVMSVPSELKLCAGMRCDAGSDESPSAIAGDRRTPAHGVEDPCGSPVPILRHHKVVRTSGIIHTETLLYATLAPPVNGALVISLSRKLDPSMTAPLSDTQNQGSSVSFVIGSLARASLAVVPGSRRSWNRRPTHNRGCS